MVVLQCGLRKFRMHRQRKIEVSSTDASGQAYKIGKIGEGKELIIKLHKAGRINNHKT